MNEMDFQTEADKQQIDMIRAFHGWTLLAARDSDDPEDAALRLAAADAFGYVLSVIDDDWMPFEDGDVERYVEVSKAVSKADDHISNGTDDGRIGLQ